MAVVPRSDKNIPHGELEVSGGNSQLTPALSDEDNIRKMIKSTENHELKCNRDFCQRTVVVYDQFARMTKSKLWNHFGKFGKIPYLKGLEFMQKSEENDGRIFTIEYHDRYTALRVLELAKEERLQLVRFLTPSLGCYQEMKIVKRITDRENNEHDFDLPCHFDKLANETIYHILSFLSFDERFRASGVSKRWQHVNKQWTDVRKIHFSDQFGYANSRTLTNDILNSLLERCGCALREINFNLCREILLPGFPIIIAKYCPNLQHINLSRTLVSPTAIKTLVQECVRLETVELQACGGVGDSCLKWLLREGQSLKYLDLSRNCEVTRKNFNSVNDPLDTLILDGCEGLVPKRFHRPETSHIQDLRVENCPFPMHAHAVYRTSRNCRQLQLRRLNLSGIPLSNDAIDCLKELPHLQYLNLNYNTMLKDEGLSCISLGGHLEHVELRGCYRVGNNGCFALFRNCPRLKSLDVCNCPRVTDDLIVEICALDREGNDKIEIRAGGSGIKQFVNDERVSVSSTNSSPYSYRSNFLSQVRNCLAVQKW